MVFSFNVFRCEMSKCGLKATQEATFFFLHFLKKLIFKSTLKSKLFSEICTEEAGGVPDHSSLHYLLGLNGLFDHQDTAEAQESIKAKINVIRNNLAQQVRGKKNISLTNEDDSK